jgi:hypothetical protein
MSGSKGEMAQRDDQVDWVEAVVARVAVVTDGELSRRNLTTGFADVLARIVESDTAGEIIPLRRRRLSRRAATIAVLALLAAGGGAAAAVKGGALTGLFGAPGSTEMDTSEYVNFAAPNFPSLAYQLGAQLHAEGLRFAPGVDPNQMVDVLVKGTQHVVSMAERGNSSTAKATRAHGMLMDVTGVKGRIAGLAQCTWQRSWLQAYEAGDGAGTNAAIKGLTALNGVVTTTRSKSGTFRGSIMAETNQKKALVGYIGRMKDNDFGFIQRITSLNCPAGP